ncbi:hypothetical protein FAZ15_07375 [Sphingobacterium olei]|uniref:Peptidase M60 domain-containing protein n=1 Tax=Sphingobacterium olei TaxID=2571155 RepID=A0A4V5MN21_9SPHI|nr:M60 family metallopeptidase [Sphingobacterium olei]TJZ62318.1 hypothetical protein FAZ15_07375 [Sphingobacterium olei]
MKSKSFALMSGWLLLAFFLSCSKKENLKSLNPIATAEKLATTNPMAITSAQIGQNTQNFTEIVDANTERKRLQVGYPMTDHEPTGFYALPNSTLTVNLELTQGNNRPTLLIGTYSRTTQRWNPQEFHLAVGNNTINVDNVGGIIWVRYTNSNPTSKAKITFTNGHVKHAVFLRDETNNTDWYNQLQTYQNVPEVLMVGARSLMVFTRDRALNTYNQDNNLVVSNGDLISNTYDYIHGLDGSIPLHTPSAHKRVLFVESDLNDLWMSAVNYRTAYHVNAAQYAFTPLIALEGWGPWHEIGHMFQQQTWKWGSMGETTVNVYTLAAERAMNIPVNQRRLIVDNVYNNVILPFFAVNESSRNFENVGAFGQLYMFHQLWLAFGDDFFIQLHRQSREHSVLADNMNDVARQRFFMVKACTISGYNLTAFFRKWGFKYDESIYTEIAGLNLPNPPQDYTLLTDLNAAEGNIIDGGIYHIITKLNNSSVVDCNSHYPVNGTAITLWTNNGGGNNQKWLARKTTDGSYIFKSMADTSKVIDVENGSSTAGTLIKMYSLHGGNNQKWSLAADGKGSYTLSPRNAPTLILDVNDMSTNNGTSLKIWNANGSNAQKFRLNRLN